MNFSLNINSQLLTSHLEGQILQGEETHMVVMEVATPLCLLVVALPLLIKIIIEAEGMAVVTQILRIIQSVKCATRWDI